MNLWLEMRTMNNGRWDVPVPGRHAASAEQEVRMTVGGRAGAGGAKGLLLHTCSFWSG